MILPVVIALRILAVMARAIIQIILAIINMVVELLSIFGGEVFGPLAEQIRVWSAELKLKC